MTLQCPLGKCQPVPIDAEAVKRDYEGSLMSAHEALEISLRRNGMLW